MSIEIQFKGKGKKKKPKNEKSFLVKSFTFFTNNWKGLLFIFVGVMIIFFPDLFFGMVFSFLEKFRGSP